MARASIFIISLYRNVFSPDHGVLRRRVRACRFYPSCSQYAIEVLRAHGFLRGSMYAIKRIMRCNPWHEGGWDPAP